MNARKRSSLSELSDAQLVRRYHELYVHLVEVALDPDHLASRTNGARWRREFEQVERACDRRGLLES